LICALYSLEILQTSPLGVSYPKSFASVFLTALFVIKYLPILTSPPLSISNTSLSAAKASSAKQRITH